MNDLENKIRKAVSSKKINLKKLGERSWYQYFIKITELVWTRNNYDGYKVEVYSEKYGTHLGTITF